MPARAICSGLAPMIDSPANPMLPRAWIMPDSARNVVVLPAPFAPRITTTSPSATVKSMPYSTCTGPYPARSSATSRRLTPRHLSRRGSQVGLDDLRVVA
jgi:hypothetical protein